MRTYVDMNEPVRVGDRSVDIREGMIHLKTCLVSIDTAYPPSIVYSKPQEHPYTPLSSYLHPRPLQPRWTSQTTTTPVHQVLSPTSTHLGMRIKLPRPTSTSPFCVPFLPLAPRSQPCQPISRPHTIPPIACGRRADRCGARS
jgi:hypothetical protein